ncbi:ABC transporter substrate-binding protein [Klenkia sp. LSe6-5]|uniref:ABC transporter substrate-binding protein n=1 Tax=Klenkia sesuvii TaxID=3103137 RepID=A0ABU8DRL0_9ACTN
MKIKTPVVLAAASSLLLLTACGSGGDNPLDSGSSVGEGTIVVGSQSFPESSLLGEVYAQALEGAGYSVERSDNIGAREVLYDQVASCDIDVTPEYNGALLAYLRAGTGETDQAPAVTTEEVDAALAEELPDQLTVLDSSSAQDNNAIVVTDDTATTYDLSTIADLAPVAGDFVFGGPPEFETRQDGIVGMSQNYGVNFAEYRVLDYSGPITITALQDGDIQAALLFSSSPEIDESGFKVLEDPDSVLGVNNIIPLGCSDSLDEGARDVLNEVSGALTTEQLVAMNRSYILDRDDVGQVATSFLEDNDIAAGSN